MKIYITHILIILFYTGLPTVVNENTRLKSDTVITSKAQSGFERDIKLVREVEYEDTDEVLLGRISSVEVDGMGRVFIADRDLVTIHVYNPDGSYLKSLGRQGRGPGEFLIVSSSTQMSVNSNRLFVTDGDGKYIHRYHEFMLDDLSLLHTVNLKIENKGNFDEEFEKYYPRWMYPRNDGKRLVAYTFIQSHEYHEKERMIRY